MCSTDELKRKKEKNEKKKLILIGTAKGGEDWDIFGSVCMYVGSNFFSFFFSLNLACGVGGGGGGERR